MFYSFYNSIYVKMCKHDSKYTEVTQRWWSLNEKPVWTLKDVFIDCILCQSNEVMDSLVHGDLCCADCVKTWPQFWAKPVVPSAAQISVWLYIMYIRQASQLTKSYYTEVTETQMSHH